MKTRSLEAADTVAADEEDDELAGAILFSRLRFADDVGAFILSPVAALDEPALW